MKKIFAICLFLVISVFPFISSATVAGSAKINTFNFPYVYNSSYIAQDITGTVNNTNATISLTVPYGTNVTALKPQITIVGNSVTPNTAVAQNFSSSNGVTYTVKDTVRNITTNYNVKVIISTNNSIKSITGFTISGGVTDTIDQVNNKITVTMPFGTNLNSLKPTSIDFSGKSISPVNGVSQNFSDSINNPVDYTVTANDTSTRVYKVTVTAAQQTNSITAFSFKKSLNTQYNSSWTQDIIGSINGTSIDIKVPFGTNITSIKPTITTSSGTISPASEVTHNFTYQSNNLYTLSQIGLSDKVYTVAITVSPDPNANTSQVITSFEVSTGTTIISNGNMINVTLPFGSTKSLSSIIPTFSIPTGTSLTVNGALQTSGVTPQSFANGPVKYTLTDGVGKTRDYYVKVEKSTVDSSTLVATPTAVTGTASSITTSSATLNATINPKNATSKAWFIYAGEDCPSVSCPEPTIKFTPTTVVANGNSDIPFSADIDSLVANATYYFKVVIKQDAPATGLTAGDIISFKTPATGTPTAVTDPADGIYKDPDGSETYFATLNGRVTLYDSGSYYFEWTEGTGSYKNREGEGVIINDPNDPTNRVSVSIGGLEVGQKYRFRVVGETAKKSYPGNEQTFQIAGPNNNPNNTTIQNQNYSQADLSYKSNGLGLIADCNNPEGCGFEELMGTVNNVIRFLLFYFATPLAALCFAYAGWLYLTSSGSEENKGKAKKIIKNVIIGYIIALAAWLIVATIMKTLIGDEKIKANPDSMFLNIK